MPLPPSLKSTLLHAGGGAAVGAALGGYTAPPDERLSGALRGGMIGGLVAGGTSAMSRGPALRGEVAQRATAALPRPTAQVLQRPPTQVVARPAQAVGRTPTQVVARPAQAVGRTPTQPINPTPTQAIGHAATLPNTRQGTGPVSSAPVTPATNPPDKPYVPDTGFSPLRNPAHARAYDQDVWNSVSQYYQRNGGSPEQAAEAYRRYMVSAEQVRNSFAQKAAHDTNADNATVDRVLKVAMGTAGGALTGAVTGALISGGASAASGERDPKKLLRNAGVGAAVGGCAGYGIAHATGNCAHAAGFDAGYARRQAAEPALKSVIEQAGARILSPLDAIHAPT